MKKDIEKKLDYIRNNINGVEDGPIEGSCMIYGDWETTIYKFLDDLVCNKTTHSKMPYWHEDFMVTPTIEYLHKALLEGQL